VVGHVARRYPDTCCSWSLRLHADKATSTSTAAATTSRRRVAQGAVAGRGDRTPTCQLQPLGQLGRQCSRARTSHTRPGESCNCPRHTSHEPFMSTRTCLRLATIKGVSIATQLNSTDPVEQRTAKSVGVFVYDVMTYKLSQLGHYVH